MRGQVLWPLRRPVAGEVFWRSDDNQPHVGADGNRNHPLGDVLPETDTRIEALGHDVGQSVVDADLQPDVWILTQQRGQFRYQDRVGRVVAAGDADGAAGFVPYLTEGRQRRLHLVDVQSRRGQEALAGLGRRDAAGRPAEQSQPEALLEAAERVAQGRLRYAHPSGRFREAPLPRHGEERENIAQIIAPHS